MFSSDVITELSKCGHKNMSSSSSLLIFAMFLRWLTSVKETVPSEFRTATI